MLVGALSSDSVLMRAICQEPAGAWKRLYWHRLVPGDKSMPLCAVVEFDGDMARVELLPALDHSTHGVTVIMPDLKRIYCGQRRPLEEARKHAYRSAVNALASRWLRRGVPGGMSLALYGHHIWAARGPELPVLLGRWVRSTNQTLRFSTDLREFYEIRDELHLWEFAPLSASSGGIVRNWHLNQEDL